MANYKMYTQYYSYNLALLTSGILFPRISFLFLIWKLKTINQANNWTVWAQNGNLKCTHPKNLKVQIKMYFYIVRQKNEVSDNLNLLQQAIHPTCKILEGVYPLSRWSLNVKITKVIPGRDNNCWAQTRSICWCDKG